MPCILRENLEVVYMIVFGDNHFQHPASAPFLIRSEDREELRVSFIIAFPKYECVPESSVGNEKLDAVLANATAVCPGEEQYEILFENYILYQVRNESYASSNNEEISTGTYLLVYEKSRLLDAIPLLTDCQILQDGIPYPGKWKHYGICCQNHIIDVITCRAPMIRKLS